VGEARTITSGTLRLDGYLARPLPSSAKGAGRYGLVLCHGFPLESEGAARAGQSFPHLADRMAADAGWVTLSFNFRGTGASQGDFSLAGWRSDVTAAVDDLLTVEGVEAAWLCGFAAGGALCLCAAGDDPRVRGVATFSAPADFGEWASDPRKLLALARSIGVVHTPGFPSDMDSWARELREIRPLAAVGKIPPRGLIIVHGSSDESVPMLDARALADAADGEVELRILAAAGHGLRHDPRAIAILLGWLDRQQL